MPQKVPDVLHVKWYNDVRLFTINLTDIVYLVNNKPVGPDQVVVHRGTAAKSDAMIAKLMVAENERLKEKLNDKAHKSSDWRS